MNIGNSHLVPLKNKAEGVSILLFILGYQFMMDSKLFQVSKEFHVVYDNVVGLERSAPVTINGMQVGKVSDIKLINAQGDGVLDLRRLGIISP